MSKINKYNFGKMLVVFLLQVAGLWKGKCMKKLPQKKKKENSFPTPTKHSCPREVSTTSVALETFVEEYGFTNTFSSLISHPNKSSEMFYRRKMLPL